MASFTPWILLSFTIVLCVTGQRDDTWFHVPVLCSCTKPDLKPGPEPPSEHVKECFIQERSRDCHGAIVVRTHEDKKLCFDPTVSWINDFINRHACEPLVVTPGF